MRKRKERNKPSFSKGREMLKAACCGHWSVVYFNSRTGETGKTEEKTETR